jgi:hypothetical protein
MERPPTPSGRRTRSKTERPSTAPPSHRSASPRATSTLGRRRQFARCPASFAAAASTPPRTGYYAPLVAATPRDDDNPFNTDSGADDNDSAEGGSPLLLTDPAGADGAPANNTDTLAAIAGASEDSSTRSSSGDPPPLAAPGTAAGVLADFAILLKKHVSALNERIDTLHAETKSNHGHITKRLFPAFDECFTNLEKALATSTEALEEKGASLLAKCTSLEDRVSSIVNGLPTASESATASPQAWPSPREPPDDSPPRFRPGPSNTPVHSVLAGSDYVRRGKRVDAAHGIPRVGHVTVVEEAATTTPPPATPLDINARTRIAYVTARATNAASHPPRETATRRSNLPVHNPYLPRTPPADYPPRDVCSRESPRCSSPAQWLKVRD